MIGKGLPRAPHGAICWQCGKRATSLLWYYQGGKGWVQRPVCQLGDGHPWDVEMAPDSSTVVETGAAIEATQHLKYNTSGVR